MSRYDVRKKFRMLKESEYHSPNAPTESDVLKARKLRNILWGAFGAVVLVVMTVLFFMVPDIFWIIAHILLIFSGITAVVGLVAVIVNAMILVSDTFHRAKVHGVREDK